MRTMPRGLINAHKQPRTEPKYRALNSRSAIPRINFRYSHNDLIAWISDPKLSLTLFPPGMSVEIIRFKSHAIFPEREKPYFRIVPIFKFLLRELKLKTRLQQFRPVVLLEQPRTELANTPAIEKFSIHEHQNGFWKFCLKQSADCVNSFDTASPSQSQSHVCG